MAFGDHWTDKWLGREWVDGQYDCVDFVVEVMSQEFGRRLRLPRTPADRADWDRTVEDLRHLHGVRTTLPETGHGVLMVAAGSRRRRHYHLGIAAVRDGRFLVLHCPRNGSSALTPAKDLGRAFQFEVEGIYRWI